MRVAIQMKNQRSAKICLNWKFERTSSEQAIQAGLGKKTTLAGKHVAAGQGIVTLGGVSA